MPRLVHQVPSYRRHKASGQAVVTLNGHDVYLGPWNTAASRREYGRIINEWEANGRQLPPSVQDHRPDLTIIELIDRYRPHIEEYYRKDGRPTRELGHVKLVLKRLKAAYGRTLAKDFGPLALKALRAGWIEAGFSRKHINTCVDRVRRMFAWAVENELLAPSVHQALKAVQGLRKGRSKAREGRKVLPVPEAFIEAVKPFLSPQINAMIELQLLTAMRPGEVCIIRGIDLEMDGNTWIYRPGRHKGEHHDHDREIHIGPRARAIIEPFLKPDLQSYLFSPADAEQARSLERRRRRVTAMTPSQAARRRTRRRRRAPGDHYDENAYRRAIARACELAYPPPEHLARHRGESRADWMARLTEQQRAELKAWRNAHHWHPHQLRHNAATRLRREFGIEVARIICGHHSALVTEIYAEQDRTLAREVMNKVG